LICCYSIITGVTVTTICVKRDIPSLAAGVNRNVIEEGAKMLEMELDYIIIETIKGMQNAAESIGLKGEL